MKELLRKLCELDAPSGYEDSVRDALKTELAGLVDELYVDTIGNLVAHRRGNGPKLMLAAHLDEIGVIVSDIDDKGFLRLLPVGYPPAAWQLVGERVAFPGGVTGVIGKEKVDEVKDTKYPKLFIDVGAASREEAARKVKVGSMGVFTRPCVDLGGRVVGKALDDRIGCVLLAQLLKDLAAQGAAGAPLAYDLYVVFTSQEEVGERGAYPAAFRLEPDVALAIDVTPAFDTPNPSANSAIALGAGPAIKVMDKGLIAHPGVKDWMIRAAEKAGVRFQLEVLERGLTDAKPIHLSREGVPTGVLSIPCRYVHTPCEMVDWADVEQAARLLGQLVRTAGEW